MKQLTYGDKDLLVGDDIADALLYYAARLATARVADTVRLNAIGSDGDEVVAMFLLGEGVQLMSESTNSTLPEPENTAALEYIDARTSQLTPTAMETEPHEELSALLHEIDFGQDSTEGAEDAGAARGTPTTP